MRFLSTRVLRIELITGLSSSRMNHLHHQRATATKNIRSKRLTAFHLIIGEMRFILSQNKTASLASITVLIVKTITAMMIEFYYARSCFMGTLEIEILSLFLLDRFDERIVER